MTSETNQSILPLRGVVQHYTWGGFRFIPDLLQFESAPSEPCAEYWMGVHPRGTASVSTSAGERPLDELIAGDPEFYLGRRVAGTFHNQLPFLFKILDVRKMLSIQAHPNKQEAKRGFRTENERGVPLDATHRVFRDENHKPEIMVALSDFWLLHGFRQKEDIARLLAEVPEFRVLRAYFVENSIEHLYGTVMEMDQSRVDQILAPMHERLKHDSFHKGQPEFWAGRAFEDYTSPEGHYDRGIFSIFLFNLVQLRPGEGIFQDAGIPHAYLEGVNVELMANSDNVFRGGLTQKHIDVPALMAHLNFRPVQPEILDGRQASATERLYSTPAPDFQLSRIVVAPGMAHEQPAQPSPHLYIILKGRVDVADGPSFQRGDCFFIAADTAYRLNSREKTILYRASVP